MKSQSIVIALSIMLVAGVATVPSYAQIVEPITISTDKDAYSAGETVIVTGQVRQSLQGAVGMVVNAPNGNRVTVDQLALESDGSFTTTFVAGGPQWQSSGTYEILVTYGVTQSNKVTNTAAIEFTGGSMAPTPDPTPVEPDPLAGITSSIIGGSITSISPGSDGISIIIIIDATDDGELTLTIPRDIFEAKEDGQSGEDIPFNILIDGGLADATETIMADSRTLVIPFTAGTEAIEVVGSWVIPEFGVIAIAILAVAIVAIIAVSSRTSVSILPRY